MAWNGIGQYVLNPSYSPEVNGTTIDATRYNGLTNDIATGITAALAKNGENVPTANLPMGGFKHTGAAVAASSGEYVTWGQNAIFGNLTFTYFTGPTLEARPASGNATLQTSRANAATGQNNVTFYTVATGSNWQLYQPISDNNLYLFSSAYGGNLATFNVNGRTSFTGVDVSGLITGSANESFRVINSSGFISGYNTAGSIRTGYLQFNAAAGGVALVSEAGGSAQLVTAGGTATLSAAGVFSVSGPITGNVTGNLTGNIIGPTSIGGNTTVTGNVNASAGMTMGNVASANPLVLDWYEEGTFTPTFGGSGSNPTCTYTTQTGTYTRIGNRVHFDITIQTTAMSGGAGTLLLNALPYTPAAAFFYGMRFLGATLPNAAAYGVTSSQSVNVMDCTVNPPSAYTIANTIANSGGGVIFVAVSGSFRI